MVLIGVSVAWIPVLQGANSGQLFIYMQSVTSSLAPPVTAVFVLGVFWRRANEQVGVEESGVGQAWLAPPSPLGWAATGSNCPLGLCPVAQLPCLPQGAFWGLMVGLAVGATRLVLEFLHPALPCGAMDTRPVILGSIHYLHFAIALFALSGAVVVAGSLLTPPPPGAQVNLPDPGL